MDLKTYQTEALKTALPTARNLDYLVPGLIAEIGECFGKIAKARRDSWGIDRLHDELSKEWGDCAWFVAIALHLEGVYETPVVKVVDATRIEHLLSLNVCATAQAYEEPACPRHWDLEEAWCILREGCESATGKLFDEVLEANLAKLKDRANRGAISGSGDQR